MIRNVLYFTDYTSQDLRWELRLLAILSSKSVPPALQRVCGQSFSVKKHHQQSRRVLLVVCDLCNALVKIFWHSKILREIQEVVIILRAKKGLGLDEENVSYKHIKTHQCLNLTPPGL